MTRCPHPLLRYPLAFLFVVAAWFLLVPALDMPVQELQGNVLLSLRATAALIVGLIHWVLLTVFTFPLL